jgi:hypothetical protein
MSTTMTSPLRLLAFAVIVVAGFCQNALAQPNQPGDAPVARANAGTVGVSGGIDGTYVRIAADLAAVLDDGQTLRVLPVLGKGSLQNLADILYLRGIDAFFTKFPELLKPPRHPKWKDVNLAAKVPGWSRFPPAQDDLARQVVAGHTDQTLRGQFAAFLAKSGVKGPLSDAQTGVMFRQFLDWQEHTKAPR